MLFVCFFLLLSLVFHKEIISEMGQLGILGPTIQGRASLTASQTFQEWNGKSNVYECVVPYACKPLWVKYFVSLIFIESNFCGSSCPQKFGPVKIQLMLVHQTQMMNSSKT